MQIEVDGHTAVLNGIQMIVEQDVMHHENHQDHVGSDNVDEPDEDSLNMKDVDRQLTTDDLSLLCDLFYLPFEHGGQGIQLLQEFNWLKSNAHIVMHKSKADELNSKADVSIAKFVGLKITKF